MQVSRLMSYAKSRRTYNKALRQYREELRSRVETVTSPRPDFRFSVDLPGAVDEQRGDIPGFRALTTEEGARLRQRRVDRSAVTSTTLGATPAISKKGMTLRTAALLLGTLLFVLTMVWIVQLNAGWTAQKSIAAAEARIAVLKTENEELQEELQASRSETSIGYEAVQMGMISSKGVEAVYLSVPGDANMLLADSGAFAK